VNELTCFTTKRTLYQHAYQIIFDIGCCRSKPVHYIRSSAEVWKPKQGMQSVTRTHHHSQSDRPIVYCNTIHATSYFIAHHPNNISARLYNNNIKQFINIGC